MEEVNFPQALIALLGIAVLYGVLATVLCRIFLTDLRTEMWENARLRHYVVALESRLPADQRDAAVVEANAAMAQYEVQP